MTSKTIGKVVSTLGDEYEGEMVDGIANGKGKIKYKDGTVYEGQMFSGVCHGQGKVVTPPALGGTVYKSNFYNNVPVGVVS